MDFSGTRVDVGLSERVGSLPGGLDGFWACLSFVKLEDFGGNMPRKGQGSRVAERLGGLFWEPQKSE